MIILVSGWIKSGKDTFANHLEKNYNYNHLAFADVLKKYVSHKYDVPLHLCYSHEGKDTLIKKVGMTVRQVLIKEGERMRQQDPYYWVNKISYVIQNNCVISDFRFPEEFQRLKELYKGEVYTVRIERPGITTITDKTEHMLDRFDFDFTILNNGTLYEFYHKIDKLMHIFYD